MRLVPLFCALMLAAGVTAGPPTRADDLTGALPFAVRFAEAQDTLPDIAVAEGIGYTELRLANPRVDPWLPGEGTLVVLPRAHVLPDAPRRGIVINLADQRLYLFPEGEPPLSFPLGIGTEGADVRVGTTHVKGRRTDPTWVPTANLRAEAPELPPSVPPGPDNPLGAYALDLGWTSIVIHGTNKPYGVGRRVSHGCFRLFNQDIAFLFRRVAIGTPVRVVNQPVKVGWRNGDLYLEVHPTIEQAQELEDTGTFTPADAPEAVRVVAQAAGGRTADVDWDAVAGAVERRDGLPVRVLEGGAAVY